MKKYIGFLIGILFASQSLVNVLPVHASTPLTLTELSFSSTSVDATYAPQPITVTAKFTDNTDGIGRFYISFLSPTYNGWQHDYPLDVTGTPIMAQCAATPIVNGEAVCVTTVVFPSNSALKHSESGTWTAFVSIGGEDFNYRTYTPTQLVAAGFPGSVNVTTNTSTDTILPTLTELSFSSSSVDTTIAPQPVAVTAKITDNTDGLGYFNIYFYGPNGTYTNFAQCFAVPIINGEGICVTTVIFPTNLPPHMAATSGTWYGYVTIKDNSNNTRNYYSTDLAAAGLPNSVNVTTSTSVDYIAPVLTDLSFSASSVDTTIAPQPVIVTAKFTDATDGLGFFSINFTGPVGWSTDTVPGNVPNVGYVTGRCDPAPIVNGETTCVATVIFPNNLPPHIYSSSGAWEAAVVIEDQNNNRSDYSASSLSSAGFPSSINVTTNTPTETIAPTLTELSFSSNSVDTTIAPKPIIVTAKFTDATDGIGYFAISFANSTWDSTSGQCSVVTIVNGEGTCVATVIFPNNQPLSYPSIDSGIWNASVLVADKFFNYQTYNSSQLSTAGFPSSVTVITND